MDESILIFNRYA